MHYSCVVVGGRIDSKSNYSAVSINRTVEIVAMLALLNVPIVFASKRSIAEKIIAAFIEASIDDIRARELYRLTH